MILSSLVLCGGLVSEEASGKHGGRCGFGGGVDNDVASPVLT